MAPDLSENIKIIVVRIVTKYFESFLFDLTNDLYMIRNYFSLIYINHLINLKLAPVLPELYLFIFFLILMYSIIANLMKSHSFLFSSSAASSICLYSSSVKRIAF